MSHHASAVWKGTLKAGAGNLTLPKANIQTSYDFQSRFETGTTTTPEELLAGAISSCFSMYLSALFSNENLENTQVKTVAKVSLDASQKPPKITAIDLAVEAHAPTLSNDRFNELVQQTESECPVANLFTGATVTTSSAILTAV